MSTINAHVYEAFSLARQGIYEESGGASHLHETDRRVYITVEGRGAFPVDQLRRYPAYPANDSSAANILGNNRRKVRLVLVGSRISQTYAADCAARFESFGWSVTDCVIHY